MSFGNHEYQHRYFINLPHKKYIQQPNRSNLISHNNYQFNQAQQHYSPQPKSHQTVTNQLNIRVRAPQNNRYQLGAQGSRIKQYVIDKFSQNYQFNRQMLDKFKHQADQYRKRKRFGSKYQKESSFQQPPVNQSYLQYQENNMNNHVNRRNHTQPQFKQQPEQHQKTYYRTRRNNFEENQVKKYNVGVMARIEHSNNYPHQNLVIRQKEKQLQKENISLKQYKKKYKILHNRLKHQIYSKKITELEMKKKQQQHMNVYQKRFQNIQKLIHDMSHKLQENSILNRNISDKSSNSLQKDKKQKETQPMKESIVFQFNDDQNTHQLSPIKHNKYQYVFQQKEDHYKSKPSPKVIYNQVQQLERQIKKYDNYTKNRLK